MGWTVKALRTLSSLTQSAEAPTLRQAPDRASCRVPLADGSIFHGAGHGSWYHPVMVSAAVIGHAAESSATLRRAMEIVKHLEPDDYLRYLLEYYAQGLERFGPAWRYADIVTALLACAELIAPADYLEIGVRRGRSMAVVGSVSPSCRLVGFDLWTRNYAGMSNPGPEFVRAELSKVGHTGPVELISGNSRETLPRYLIERPDAYFDLVTVDGDHSADGARQDLITVKPRIKIGGALVFDDICHPAHPYLFDIWEETVAADPAYSSWAFTDLGYGVAVAVRKG